jgi:predicted phosphodiesterase
MKIALIADVHGNTLALDRIIKEARSQGAERLISLGDFIANGPFPVETLKMHRENGVEMIRGNTEDYIADAYRHERKSESFLALGDTIRTSIEWCSQLFTGEEISFLESLPISIEISLPDGSKLLCYHGTPASNLGVLRENSDDAIFESIIEENGSQYYAGGHTHNMYIKRYKGKIFINPGCSGMPICSYAEGKPASFFAGTEYVMLEVSEKGGFIASIRRIEICKKELLGLVQSSDMPNKEARLAMIENCCCAK